MKNLVFGAILKSKKFWYAMASILVPLISNALGLDEETCTKMFYSFVSLIIGQGIADTAKKK
tara:strand:+ start:227 stop:412 length:186 start_codon:yes stop_codon:yes gene_type:complete